MDGTNYRTKSPKKLPRKDFVEKDFAPVIGFFHIFMLSLISVGLLGLVGAYAFFRWKYRFWRNQNMKTTKPVFPLGDITQVAFSKNIGTVFKEIYDSFKGERYAGLWVIHRPYLMVRDPDLIKIMFVRDFNCFRDRGLYVNEKSDPLSANLFFIGGARWRNLRTKLSMNFTSYKMRKMFGIMAEKGDKLREILGKSASESEDIRIKGYTVGYTHEVVASCFLGLQADSIRNPKSVFHQLGRKVFEPSWSAIIRAGFSFLVPDLAEFLGIVATPKMVTEFFMKAIREVMLSREAKGFKYSDFMQSLIHLKNEGFTEDPEQNEPNHKHSRLCHEFTFDSAVAQAFIFWVGGFEASASTMQFALYEMSMNRTIQDRARNEIKTVLARYGGEVTYEAVLEMKYLSRVVHETLRKYPPVTILNRVCTKAYKIPGSDVAIEEGTPVIVSILGIHMDPEYFPEPEKFDPERFTEQQKSTRHHYSYLPFGEGPHACIGQRFAILQIKVGLANLLSNYEFEVTQKTPKKPICDRKLILYTVKNGIYLKISKVKE